MIALKSAQKTKVETAPRGAVPIPLHRYNGKSGTRAQRPLIYIGAGVKGEA